MGALLTDLGELDEAVDHLDRAIRIDSSDGLAFGHKVLALWDKRGPHWCRGVRP
jgi:hypothetical protein